MSGGIYYIRLVGGIVIWLLKRFKVPLKDCIHKGKNAVEVGVITILLIAYIIFLFYVYIIN